MSFAEVKAPRTGGVKYDAVTTSASTVKEIDRQQLGYYTFMSNVDLWILFGSDSTVPDPDETELVDTEADLPFKLKADTPTHWRIGNATRFFKQKGTATGELRFYKSGE